MQLIKIAGVALALLMVTGTAAAMPGAAAAQADENTDENASPEQEDVTDDENASDADEKRDAAAERGPDRRGAPADADRGPPADLPAQVPDFVGDRHDTIEQFIDGDLGGSLGERLSELTPGDDGDSDDETATPTAQAGA